METPKELQALINEFDAVPNKKTVEAALAEGRILNRIVELIATDRRYGSFAMLARKDVNDGDAPLQVSAQWSIALRAIASAVDAGLIKTKDFRSVNDAVAGAKAALPARPRGGGKNVRRIEAAATRAINALVEAVGRKEAGKYVREALKG